jgi:hypothetical protein
MVSVILLVILSLLGFLSPAARPNAKPSVPAPGQQAARSRVLRAYAALPLSFEANRGQAPRGAQFLGRVPGYTLSLQPGEAVLELQEPGVRSQESAESRQSSAVSRQSLRDDAITRRLSSAKDNGLRTNDKGLRTNDALLRMKLVNANQNAPAVALDELPGKTNYFIGKDSSRWLTNVPTYGKVGFKNVYAGIDVFYYGTQGRLEYDFVVAPGADPKRIALALETASSKFETRKSKFGSRMRVDANGDLIVRTAGGEVVFHRPVAYQEQPSAVSRQLSVEVKDPHAVDALGSPVGRPSVGDGLLTTDNGQQTTDNRQSAIDNRQYVEGRYLLAQNCVTFALGPYDHSRPLVIDPFLVYSTYLGGNQGDIGFGIAVDASGDAYIAGATGSTNFPTAGPAQTTKRGTTNAFVTKLNPAGTALVYSTYLGGSTTDRATGIAVDGNGNAYVVGTTSSTDFPVSPAANSPTPAFQTTYGGGTSDAFVTKLSATGSALTYSSYLGGTLSDFGFGIAVDPSGNAYVTGSTQSKDFPVVTPFQPGNDGDSDAFVTKVNLAGTALVYSTYLGGTNADSGQGIAVDAGGSAYVTGYTYSTNFPIQAPLQPQNNGSADAFVTKLNPAGTSLVFSTYFGGSGQDRGAAIAIDNAFNVYITGDSQSGTNFPITAGVVQPTNNGNDDAFVAKITADGATLAYSTFLGGTALDQGTAIAVDPSGDAWVAGFTESADFPKANAVQANFGGGTCGGLPCPDAFVAELNPQATLLLFSTYLGGNGADFGQGIAVAVDTNNALNAYVTGSTASTNFTPVAPAYQGTPGDTAGDGDAFVAKIGPANSPSTALSPQSINFGNQAYQLPSTQQLVTLTNVGTAVLTITSITSTNTDFTLSDAACIGSILPSGGTCTIGITFTPNTLTTETTQISIADNATGTPHLITATGTGVTPTTTITFSPASVSFGNQSVNTASPQQTIKVTNTGNTTLTISTISVSPTSDFAQTNNCPNTAIQANTFCTIFVTFTPSASGNRSGTVSVTANTTPATQSVSLTGTGIAGYSLTVPSPSQVLTIGSTTATFNVTLVGPTNLNGTSVTLGCAGATCTFSNTGTNGTLVLGTTITSVMTVSGLTSSSPNPLNFSVTGSSTSPQQTATLNLAIFFSDFTLAETPNLISIAAGSSATFTITVTPTNGFNKAVLLSCPVGLPASATCVFSPSAVSLNGTANSTATLTITTTARSGAPPASHRTVPPGALPILFPLLLTLLLVLAASRYRRSSAKFRVSNFEFPVSSFQFRFLPRSAMVLIAALLVVALSSGCNSYITNLISPAPGTGTPAGNYTIGVEGTLSGTTTVNRGTTVNLAVS